MVTAEASVAEIGLLMGGIHGLDAPPPAPGAGHAA